MYGNTIEIIVITITEYFSQQFLHFSLTETNMHIYLCSLSG